MRLRYSSILLILFAFLAGCKDEEALSPSTEPEPVVNGSWIPQGSNEYDTRIVEFYNRYNSVILYRYQDHLFWTNVTTDIRWTFLESAGRIQAGYEAEPAVEEYVPQVLDFMQDRFCAHYPDNILKEGLPITILLTGNMYHVPVQESTTGIPTIKDVTYAMYQTYHMAVNGASAQWESWTADEKNQLKLELNYNFLLRCIEKEIVTIPDEFYDVSASFYGMSTSGMTIAQAYGYGFLSISSRMDGDPGNYLAIMLAIPYGELTAESGDANYLHPSKDTNGRIRQKYDILTGFFLSEYGIDLQAIGNDLIE